MRDARQTGASLFLAFEQDNFRKVIAEGDAPSSSPGRSEGQPRSCAEEARRGSEAPIGSYDLGRSGTND